MDTLCALISLIFMTILPSEYHGLHFINGDIETQGSGIPVQILMLQIWLEAQAFSPIPRYLLGIMSFLLRYTSPSGGKKRVNS